MVACFPRGKLLLFSVYGNSSHLMTCVEYFGIIGSRLIAECFAFIFHYNLTAADMKKFRVSAYKRISTVCINYKVGQIIMFYHIITLQGIEVARR